MNQSNELKKGEGPPIIVLGYSRHDSLQRLLDSLNRAVYPNDRIKLIISIDGGAYEKVIRVAEQFRFEHGTKSVITREENLGLTNHILWCGDQTQKYGSVIILEDDLMVDTHFYSYADAALDFYRYDENIAGVALHSPRHNQMAKVGFEPMQNGFSAYFMKKVCSWGQAWTAGQWRRFREWYRNYDEEESAQSPKVPRYIKSWLTWDKPFSVYMIEKDLYFVYPYLGYSTNCADPGGVHMVRGTDMLQVPLGAANRDKEDFRFCRFRDGTVFYDAFLEPEAPELYESLDVSPGQIEIDINGAKPMELIRKKKFILTSKKCKSPFKTFRLGFRPAEKTVLNEISNEEPSKRFSEKIYFAETSNIISEKRPYYEQINYHSYYQVENKYFCRRYLLHMLSKKFPKLWGWTYKLITR